MKKTAIILLTLMMVACVPAVRSAPQIRIPPSFQSPEYATLPELTTFATNKSDQFLVDLALVSRGNPYMVSGAIIPMSVRMSILINLAGSGQGDTAPDNYPPIYAVADGDISSITESLRVGQNDRYGIYLAIAHAGNTIWSFEYSIEPFAPEPSPGFYSKFITVHAGDKVKKGQIIGYMYLPFAQADNSHIHFELISEDDGKMKPPAIFTRELVQQFHDHWQEGGIEGQTEMPVCMGWMLAADENPFADTDVDCIP